MYLINDNTNSFSYVWATIMEHVHSNPIQAEQICQITNDNGRCHIKSGDVIELLELREILVEKGLKVELHIMKI